MKKLLTSAFVLCTMYSAMAQITVRMKSGNFTNNEFAQNTTNSKEHFKPVLFEGKYYVWLQFTEMPDASAKSTLKAAGVELFDYLPDNTFIAAIPEKTDFSSLKALGAYSTMKPVAIAKIDPVFNSTVDIPWAVEGDLLKVRISFVRKFSKEKIAELLTGKDISFTNISSKEKDVLTIKVKASELINIAEHPLVQFIEPIGPPPATENDEATTDHRINILYMENYNAARKYRADNINVVLGDDGYVEHIDYKNRVLENSTVQGTSHGDHTAGIIAGAGNLDPTLRGQAPGANLIVWDYWDDLSEYPQMYTVKNARVTSHSLGQNCNQGYDTYARESDDQIYTYPLLNHVHSAGNSGNSSCGGFSAGWRTITGGYKAGKNVIACANVDKQDVVNYSSSKGPTKDGRIKPDIAAVGTNVVSTQPNNTYASLTGTSMACPAVAGTLAVLNGAFTQLKGSEPAGGLLKAILLNTADDLGNTGPDFTYGWGRENARRAIECIEGTRYFSSSVDQGNKNNHTITIPANVAVAKIMVYWVDYPGTAGASQALVNDLDIFVKSPSNVKFQPWLMDAGNNPTAASCSAPAVKGADRKNNVEQVQIDNPAAGNYKLQVKGRTVPEGPQTYYVVYEFLYNDNIVVTYPFGGESLVPAEVQRIRWDATLNSGNFSIDYSNDNGSSWSSVATGITGSRRYYDWTVPNDKTGEALIRVSRGSASDVSDTGFNVMKVPENITFTMVCQGTTTISWDAVSGATSYDVFELGNKYMEQVGNSATTSITLSGLGNGENWFSVRARKDNKIIGRRAKAKKHKNTSGASCFSAARTYNVTLNAVKNNEAVVLNWNNTDDNNISSYTLEKSADATFDHIEKIKEVNTAAQKSPAYSFTDNSAFNEAAVFYRIKITAKDGSVSYSKLAEVNTVNLITAFKTYPSPAKEVLNIQSSKPGKACTVNIYTTDGRNALSKTNVFAQGSTATLALQTLTPGMYHITIRDQQTGKTMYHSPFIVAK